MKDSGSPQVIEDYLSIFGDCAIYSGLAREKLAALQGGQPASAGAATEVQPSQQQVSAEEPVQVARSLSSHERLCLNKAMPPHHVEGIPGVVWKNISVQQALVACAPVAELEHPNADALAAYGRVLSKAERYSEAFRVSQRAAELGSGFAASTLGQIFAKGRGVSKDYKRAIQFYEIAAERGSTHGYYNLGDAYQNGKGVEVNGPLALSYFEAAAALGDGDAYDRIGGIYRKGEIVAQDTTKAMEAYLEAYQRGYHKSGAYIGYILETGQGGYPQDESLALEWYAQVIAKGEYVDWATYRAGNMFRDGRGVVADEEQAAGLYVLGVNQDYAPSMRELGKLYYSWGMYEDAEVELRRAGLRDDEEAFVLLERWFSD
ncbi:sel1 repeat family protein [Shimia sp. R10_1]|uniref:tetratricopeptide repeat protein n=1 Tax=Shimia sp. R10_1 TaxID=2821095 RepID=UPI001ADC38DA|nr:sel1 repeat family protein [Shimia sp. R10_1]